MNFLFILTFTMLFATGLCAAASSESSEVNDYESLSQKEKLRLRLLQELQQFSQGGIESHCRRPLSPKQIVFGNQKLEEFVECGNATIDIFIAKLDQDVDFYDHPNISTKIRQYASPVCEVFDDIFRCVGELEPVFDMCLLEREQIFKDKLFGIVPLIQQTACLRNGDLIADIVEHEDGLKCTQRTFYSMVGIGFIELFDSHSTELFGDEKVCQRFSDVLKTIYLKVGECSMDVLGQVKDMLGFFCDGTHCDRFIPDLQCY